MTMALLVRLCALYNASVLIVFLVPGLLPALGVTPPSAPVWLWLPALLGSYGAIVLWLSAADLRRHATFPYWNGVIRLVYAVVSFALDFGGSAGALFLLIAIGDFFLGAACVLGLPRAAARTHLQLLTNRDAR